MSALSSFERNYIPEPNSGCWIWTASLNEQGYANFYGKKRNGKGGRAHRWAYEYFVGMVPAGKQLDHLCGMRCCVNPDHLEIVTPLENVRRGKNHVANRTHCPHGHEYSVRNTYFKRTHCKRYIQRICKKCHYE